MRKTLQNLRAQRRNRFRILACIDGTEEALITVRFAARLAPSDECDIIVLYVRPVDQGLWSGGLQVKLARQNMMEAGFELPGVRDLKKALAVLNPNRPDCSYVEKNLCGAGVAFKVIQALLPTLGWAPEKVRRVSESFLKLAAIATVADVVPLTGENRIIVAHGLRGLGAVRNLP